MTSDKQRKVSLQLPSEEAKATNLHNIEELSGKPLHEKDEQDALKHTWHLREVAWCIHYLTGLTV